MSEQEVAVLSEEQQKQLDLYNKEIDDLILEVKVNRKVMENVKQEYTELITTPKILKTKELLDIEKQKTEQSESLLRSKALQIYEITGDKKINSVCSIREMKVIEYDLQKAISWCVDNLRKALTLDKKLFEKHAKAVAETAPLDFVLISSSPSSTIATDIQKALSG